MSQRWKPVLAALLGVIAIAGLGMLSTDLGSWYRGLQKPAWQPPDWLFGPVWTTIYALAAIAGVRAWRAAASQSSRDWIIALFALNGFLNVLWSLLFFRLRRPDWALVEVGFLWASILLLIVVLGRHSRSAGWLLVPYLVWVGFAAVLNLSVVRLNAPFG